MKYDDEILVNGRRKRFPFKRCSKDCVTFVILILGFGKESKAHVPETWLIPDIGKPQ